MTTATREGTRHGVWIRDFQTGEELAKHVDLSKLRGGAQHQPPVGITRRLASGPAVKWLRSAGKRTPATAQGHATQTEPLQVSTLSVAQIY
ncbi:MAG TPA: hypothetical protein VFO75_03660 [Candidatus Dormibacteraeota bacterium]|nr:hypothetical protein [Candidatus Dormibacteraeota bacterium]